MATTGLPEEIVKLALPPLIGWFLGRGDRKTETQADQQQMAIAEALFNMTKQRHTADMGLRLPLNEALKSRMQKQQPRMLPGQAALTNPYRNVQQMQRNIAPIGGPGGVRSNQQVPIGGFSPEMLRQRMQGQQFQGTPALTGALQRVGYRRPSQPTGLPDE